MCVLARFARRRYPGTVDDILDSRLDPPDPIEREDKPPLGPARQYSAGRAALLLLLVLAVQLGVVSVFVSALDSAPTSDLPVAVMSSDATVSRVAGQFATPTEQYSDRDTALQAVHDRRAYAALVPDGAGGVELRIAAAGTDPAVRRLTWGYREAAIKSGVRATVIDNYSPNTNNPRNVTTFYLVVSWVVGGFLAATALAIALGAIPASERRTQARVLALLAYSLVSGIAGAIVLGPALDAGPGYGLALATFGSMITFGAAMTAAALQGWFGVLGAAAALGLFLLLGDPASGDPLVPQLDDWALTGAGTQLVRGVVQFGGGGGANELLALWIYCFGGAVAFLVAGHVRPGRGRSRLTGR
jgi:hypothetical protein